MSARPDLKRRRAALLSSVAECAEELARDFGLTAEIAEQMGAAVADALAEQWGGEVITIPKDFHYGLSRRDLAILEQRRKGTSPQEIAKLYGMHIRSVYRLLKRSELRYREQRQTELFRE